MKTIWIVLQQRDGALHRMAREAIAAGQRVAELSGARVEALVLGATTAQAAAEACGYRLDKVWTVDSEALAAYTPGAYVDALAPAVREHQPDLVLLPHTYQSVDFMGLLAARAGAGLLPEIIAVRDAGDGLVWRRPILGGKLHSEVRIKGEGPVVVSVQSGAFLGDQAVAGECTAEPLPGDHSVLVADREILGVEEVGGDQVDLSQAEVVVAVGRGVGGEDKLGAVHELAEVLGAELGASRPVIDSGWLPRDRQIGSSGQTVAPKLYIALGISGAIQHLVGMKGAQTVVAVNKDPGAPIFNNAHFGVVGDLHELLPPLIEKIKEARGA